jgi:hypothetical protein
MGRVADGVRAVPLSLLQLRVLRFGFLQNGDVRVGVGVGVFR